MPLNHVIELMGIKDAKFTPSGGTLTDIYAIGDLKISGEFTEKDVRGDNKVIGYFSKLDTASVDISQASIDLDAIGALTGNTPTDTGTTPSQISTLDLIAGPMPYGVLEGQGTLIDQNGSGDAVADVHFKIMKFKINKLDIDAKSEDVAVVSFSGKAIPDATSNLIVRLVYNETETAIA